MAYIQSTQAERVERAKREHAAQLARTDSAGRPLYRVTSGGNIVRTKPITQPLKAKVLARDGHACVECGATAKRHGVLHVAHIEAYRVNGNNDLDNLRTLCPPCHKAETVTDWTVRAAAQAEAWLLYWRESMAEMGFTPEEIAEFERRSEVRC